MRGRDILELAEKPRRNGRCASVGISGGNGLGGIFADVIEGAGNVGSREGTQRNLYGVHTPTYHNNEFATNENLPR